MRDIDHLRRLAAEAGRRHRRLRRRAVGRPAAVDQDAPGLRPVGPGQASGGPTGSRRRAPGRSRPRRSTSALIGRMIERATEADRQDTAPPPRRRARRPASPATPAHFAVTAAGGQARLGMSHRRRPHRLRRAAVAAAPRQARPLPRHPARAPRPGPRSTTSATPSSWSWSWPTRSPAGTPPRPGCGPGPPTSTRPWASTHWDDTASVSFDRAAVDELYHAALRRRRQQRADPRARSGSARPSWPPRSATSPSAGAQRALRAGRPAPQTAEGLPARHQPRRRDPQADPGRPAHPGRLLPSAAMDAVDTAEIYEMVVERHRAGGHGDHLQPRTQSSGWP